MKSNGVTIRHVIVKDIDDSDVNALFIDKGLSSVRFDDLPESFRSLPNDAKVIVNPHVDKEGHIVYFNHADRFIHPVVRNMATVSPRVESMQHFRLMHESVYSGFSLFGILLVFGFLLILTAMFSKVGKKW